MIVAWECCAWMGVAALAGPGAAVEQGSTLPGCRHGYEPAGRDPEQGVQPVCGSMSSRTGCGRSKPTNASWAICATC